MCRSAHPEHRRRIVDLSQSLWILGATECHDRCALFRNARPFFFCRAASLAVKDELRGLGGKVQSFQFGEREREYLAGRAQPSKCIEDSPGTETGRKNQGQPRESVFIKMSFVWNFDRTIRFLIHYRYHVC